MANNNNKIYDSAEENNVPNNFDENSFSLDSINDLIDSATKDSNTSNEDNSDDINRIKEIGNSNTNSDSNNNSATHTNAQSPEEPKYDIAEALDVYNILTIDDDKWIQRIFSQYLNQWGFNNISAMDPFSGLEEAIRNKPLIIFLDIVMPEVNGDLLIKFLKKLEYTSKIPVVIISGNLNKELIKNTYLSGAAGFITKPFNQETLFNKIKEVLDPAIFNRMIKDGKINTAQIKKKAQLGI